jgi:CRP-like cAMP-binding protein
LAFDDISVCFIPKEAALTLFKENPSIILRIMRKLCERITSIEERMDNRDATETL